MRMAYNKAICPQGVAAQPCPWMVDQEQGCVHFSIHIRQESCAALYCLRKYGDYGEIDPSCIVYKEVKGCPSMTTAVTIVEKFSKALKYGRVMLLRSVRLVTQRILSGLLGRQISV